MDSVKLRKAPIFNIKFPSPGQLFFPKLFPIIPGHTEKKRVWPFYCNDS